MPLVKYSALVTRMSGKLNGSVFAFNQGGDYFRNNKQGKGKTSDRWQQNKALWANLSTHWRNLTDEERAEWVAITPLYPTLNRFGVERTPTGYELYMRLNGAMLMNRLGNSLTPDNPEEEDELGVLTASATTNPAPFAVTWRITRGAGPALTPVILKVDGVTIMDSTATAYYDLGWSDAVNQAGLQALLPAGVTILVTTIDPSNTDLKFTFTQASGYWGGTTEALVTGATWTVVSSQPVILPPVIISIAFSEAVTAGTVVCGYCGSYESAGSRPRPGLQKWMANQADIAVQSLDISMAFYEQYGSPITDGLVNAYLRVIRTNTGQQGQRRWVVIVFNGI